MVDIVQSSNAKLLIRKIGYSVGLELTLKRINFLLDSYIEERQITNSTWNGIVTAPEKYDRQLSQAKHFENVFGVLGVMSMENGRPVPKYILDTLRLLKLHFGSDSIRYADASKAVFLYALLLADGELFANLLSVNFKKTKFEKILTEYREKKLNYLYQFYKSNYDREKLYRTINFIELDKSALMSARENARIGPLAKSQSSKVLDLNDFKVSLSEDWMKKVPNNRKSWALDLGLYSEEGITSSGKNLLRGLRELNLMRSTPADVKAIILAPTDIEMISNHMTWAPSDTALVGFHDLMRVISQTYLGKSKGNSLIEFQQMCVLLPWVFENYSNADTRFHMLRREVPYTIFILFYLGLSVAHSTGVDDFENMPEFLRVNCSRAKLRKSRNSLWGISVS